MPNYSIPRRIWRLIYPPLIYISVSFVVVILASVIYGGYLGASSMTDSSITLDAQYILEKSTEFLANNVMLFQLISVIISLCIFAPMWKKTSKIIPKYSGNKVTLPIVALSILAGWGLSLLIGSIITAANLIEYFPSYNEISSFLTEGNIILTIITVVIIAPVVEEFILRGIVFNRLLYWTPTWVAVVVQSAIFGIMHLNMLQGIYAFVLGLALSLLYVRFRNIWVPIIGHIAINSASYIVNGFFAAIGVEEVNTLFIMVPSALVFGVCAWMLTKQPTPTLIVPVPEEEKVDVDQ